MNGRHPVFTLIFHTILYIKDHADSTYRRPVLGDIPGDIIVGPDTMEGSVYR